MSRTQYMTGMIMFNSFEFMYYCIKVRGILRYFYTCILTVIHNFIRYCCCLLYIIENFTTGRFYCKISQLWNFPMIHIKSDNFIVQVSHEPNSKLIGFSYIEILSDMSLVNRDSHKMRPGETRWVGYKASETGT